MPDRDITVKVHGDGKVEVNGVLCAEVAVGQVDTRDDLEQQLTLNRISRLILGALDALARELKNHNAEDVAEGLVDGVKLISKTIDSGGTLFELPPKHGHDYRAGYAAGQRLAVMRSHLHRYLDGDESLAESSDFLGGAA